jgi:hypothetical protein
MAKNELLDVLRKLLEGVLTARFGGTSGQRLSRAHGYADGYMRALQDAGLVTREELLAVVGEENRRFVAADDTRRAADAAADAA